MDSNLKGKIHYYGREKFYQAMLDAAIEGGRRFSGDPVLRLYSALAQLLQGQTQEAIGQLESLTADKEVSLGAILALISAHKRRQVADKQVISELDAKLKEDRKKVTEIPLYYGGLVLFFIGKYEKAREYIDRMLKIKPDFIDGEALKGWIELTAGRDSKSKNSLEYFEAVLSRQPKHMDAIFGKAKYFECSNMYKESRDTLALLVVANPSFMAPLVENIKVYLAEQNWDMTSEAVNRVLSTDPHNIEALKYSILITLCRRGNYEEASQQIRDIYSEMERSEPNNAPLFIHMAQLFSRVCGRNNLILDETYMMASKAARIDSSSCEFLTEVGYQSLMQGRQKEALKFYKNATKLDESSVAALTGIISCQLLEGKSDVAEQQLDFLKEVQQTLGATPEILYMSGVLARMKNQSTEKILDLLEKSLEAVENQFRTSRPMVFGAQYLTTINPDFLLMIVEECLSFAPTQPNSENSTTPLPPVISRCLHVLETITRACPALLPAIILSARTKFITGDIKGAESTLQHVFDNIDSTSSEAHLLMAQIQLEQGNALQAQQSLEVGLSYNFEVRDYPIYHLIRARILKMQNQLDEAIKTLRSSLTMSKNRSTIRPGKTKTSLSIPEKASMAMELCDALLRNNQPQEAAEAMQQAMEEFKGTEEETKLTLTSADLAISRGDMERALSILKNIDPSHKYFLQARNKMANIYLEHLNDKRMFAACYREIVEKNPTPQSFMLLGDAYMSIQEPDRAIEVYEQAMKRNPRDSVLACKMGQALIKTHHYTKAINYYQEAIKTGGPNQLRYDMAELQMRMKQYDKAEKTIKLALKAESIGTTDLSSMLSQAKLLNLLSKVYERAENYEESMTTLRHGKDLQVKVLKRAQVEMPDAVVQQKELAASMCCKMADYSTDERDFETAVALYKEALSYQPESPSTLYSLANIYLLMKDLEQCQYTCTTLLRMDKDNDNATLMLADLSYRKNEYETAMFHFQQLLDRKPIYFNALARLVEVMRRTGTLQEAIPYLDKAEHAVLKPTTDSGFNFCKGLYEWYSGNPNGALKYFNKARRDNEWGQRAIYNMIEICLNPDNDTLGGETFESVDSELGGSSRDTHDMATRTADKLIKELKPRPGEQQVTVQILTGFLMLATRQKSNAEQALAEFMRIANQENYKDHVGAILGMATAHMILKQTPKARNQLKRVARCEWTFEDAEYLERCWLLLADVYVQTGKYDMATELLKRVLFHNRSCMKAYEYMGFIMEKEQSYRDAAYHYEQAWKFGSNSNPVIGYKLAFNYMKAKRFVDAVDVCHAVLAKHPDYPRIRKEILDKSRASIRT